MEPVTILAITNASLGIARSLVHTIQQLYELAEAYETAALGIRTVATQCNSFRIAIERINKWLVRQDESSKHDLDDDFWDALKGNLDTGALVVDDLNRRIQGFKKNPAKFWTRTKYLWNHVVISDLQSQIMSLMAAVSLLVQVIDIPTTGGKQNMSRAQSTRLNGLTRSARKRVEQQQQDHITTEQKLLDDADTAPVHPDVAPMSMVRPAFATTRPLHNQNQAIDAVVDRTCMSDAAPPPYVASAESNYAIPSYGKEKSSPPDHDLLPEAESKQMSFMLLNKSKSREDKQPKSKEEKSSKRPAWRDFMKRSSDKQGPTGSASDAVNNTAITAISGRPFVAQPGTGSETLTQSPQSAPDVSSEQSSYFGLQSAMSGVMVDSSITGIQQPAELHSSLPSTGASEPIPAGISSPDITTSSSDKEFQSNNPYLAMRLASRSRSETDFGSSPPDYAPAHGDSANNFDRIRPSQRVRDSHERSISQGPTGCTPSGSTTPNSSQGPERQLSGGISRISSLGMSRSDSQQNWQTTSITNRTMKFKVQFEPESFTNKISSTAARALGVDDAVAQYAGFPITHLTLLHIVSDGSSAAETTVNGDEVEFVMMHENESRVPELILGAGFAHLVRIMEEGQYIYWNPRAIPERLRSIDKLRLYRRFELVRW